MLDKTMTTRLILDAFNMAVKTREYEPEMILHSDQGVQYRVRDYALALYDENITLGMSRKGNCWDNAAMESFFLRLKVEEVFAYLYEYLGEVYSSVFEFIELFYSPIRRHSANEQVSLLVFENMYNVMCA